MSAPVILTGSTALAVSNDQLRDELRDLQTAHAITLGQVDSLRRSLLARSQRIARLERRCELAAQLLAGALEVITPVVARISLGRRAWRERATRWMQEYDRWCSTGAASDDSSTAPENN